LEINMRIYKLGALAIVPLFLLGCPSPDDRDTTYDDDPAVAEERAHDVGDTETLNLGEIEDSGVTGDVRFTVISMNETEVLVEVDDAHPNTTYHAAIHQGTCDNVGQQRHDLGTIQTNAEGDGATTMTLNVRLVDVMDGRHVVALYGAADTDADHTADQRTDAQDRDAQDRDAMTTAGPQGLPVACGEISEHGTLGW
jgi:hypothetical protein